MSASPSSKNGPEEEGSEERFTGNNYEAATEIRRLGSIEFYFILSLHSSFKHASYNYAINLAM